MTFSIILFDDFETLDAFGPAEVVGKLSSIFDMKYHSLNGGIVRSSQQVPVDTRPFSEIDTAGVILIPGGMGTRKMINDGDFIEKIKDLATQAPYVLTVCTGAALLAKTKLLDGLKATSNKAAIDWVCSVNKDVNWIKKARWVNDGKYYSSSGVSAGIDMTLGFISDLYGNDTANSIARGIEYIWNSDKDNDPFASTTTEGGQ